MSGAFAWASISLRGALVAYASLFCATGAAQDPPGVTGAMAVDVAELERLAGDLRSSEAPTRAQAIVRLGTLPEDALPAITERVRYLARLVIPAEDGDDAIRRFRLATGSRRADDMIDIAPGIGEVLAEDRSPVVGRAAERVLLIRSLERMDSLEAWRLLPELFALTPEMWRWEKRRLVHRLGARVLPALLLSRGHRDADVRRWARDGVAQLGLASPADALQEEDPGRLAMLVTAYSEVRDLDAMPVMVAFVDHPDRELRDATRAAMERYGQNGIWQLRIAFRNKLAAEPDLDWGWRRTMTELYQRLDEVRLGPMNARLDEAVAALEEGDAPAAQRMVEEVLRDEPQPPRPEVVAGVLAGVASTVATEGASGEALRLVRRALWLAPNHPDAATWRARELFLEAELDHARGVLDVDAYRTASSLLTEPEERARLSSVLPEVGVAPDVAPSAGEDESDGTPLEDVGLLILVLLGLGVGFAHRAQVRQAVRRLVRGRPASGTLATWIASAWRSSDRKTDDEGGAEPSPIAASRAPTRSSVPEGAARRGAASSEALEPGPARREASRWARAWVSLERAIGAGLVVLGSPVVSWFEARALARRRRQLGARHLPRRRERNEGQVPTRTTSERERRREPASLDAALVTGTEPERRREPASLDAALVTGTEPERRRELASLEAVLVTGTVRERREPDSLDGTRSVRERQEPASLDPMLVVSRAPALADRREDTFDEPLEDTLDEPLEDTLDEPLEDTLDAPLAVAEPLTSCGARFDRDHVDGDDDDEDAVRLSKSMDPLAALLLGDPNDTLPGAPAPD